MDAQRRKLAVQADGSSGVCWKIPLLGHDHVTWPTRKDAEAEIDRLMLATGCARPEPQPIRFA